MYAARPWGWSMIVPATEIAEAAAPSSSLVDGRGLRGHAGAMGARLEHDRADEQVRIEVQLGAQDPLGQLRGLRAAGLQLEDWQRQVITQAREQGVPWSKIAEALGVSKQAAWATYNETVRSALAEARARSGLTDEEAQGLADEERANRRPGAA